MLYTSFGLELQYVSPFSRVQTSALLDEVYGVESQASKLEHTSHDRVLHEFHAIFAKSGQAVLGNHTYKILVLKEHTTIVGAVLYHTQKMAETTHTCTIELLGIQPTVQRSGYGTILAALTLEKERKEGCQKADLRTSVAAIHMYLKFGFIPSHLTPPKEEWYALTPAEQHKMITHSIDTASSVLTDLELDLTQSILQPRLESLLTCATHFTAADYERKQATILKDIPVPQQFDDWSFLE